MPVPLIAGLIDKTDGFELVRDQVAAILAAEVASQKALAIANAPPKDPLLWDLRIFSERSEPWGEFVSAPTDPALCTPLVNVSYHRSDFDEAASDLAERQKSHTILLVDVYGYGFAADVSAGGHKAADVQARAARDRGVRLVRNILMSANYVDLGLPGFVYGRWLVSSEAMIFQDDNDRTVPAQQIAASRMTFRVSHDEFSPQISAELMEIAVVTVKRTANGQVLFEATFEAGEDGE
jgi:hypothetical protein